MTPGTENNQLKDKLTRQLNYSFDIRRVFAAFLSNWYWFLIALIIAVGGGLAYLRYTTPLYSIHASLLLEDKSSGMSSIISKINPDKEGNEGPNMYNEIFILHSQDLIGSVVDSMDLNIHYWTKGRVKDEELWEHSPIRFEFDKNGYTGTGETEIILRQVAKNEFELKENTGTSRVSVGSLLQRPYGNFRIKYSDAASAGAASLQSKNTLKVKIEPATSEILKLQSVFKVVPGDGRTSLVELSITDNLPERGVAFLNKLLLFYRRNELVNATEFARKTRQFIADKMADLGGKLSATDLSVQRIKEANGGADASAASTYMGQAMSANEEIAKLAAKRQALSQLKASARSNSKTIIGSAVDDPQISALINQYQMAQQQVEFYEKGSGPNDPKLAIARSEAQALRNRIAEATDRASGEVNISISSASSMANAASGKMRSMPGTSRAINDVTREYDVLQKNYLYLYQKMIENDIAENAAQNKSKIVGVPYAPGIPISPVRRNVLTLCGVLGLLFPAILLLGKEFLNNKVNNEQDITNLTDIPILGSVSKAKTTGDIVVGEQVRTGIAEQFRLIRANLEFMGTTDNRKVIMITSSVSGEGKTFITLNLGLTLALTKKRVLIMEFDLRKPKLSERLNLSRDGGISGYLAGLVGMEKVIKPSGVHENLYVANCGPLPPNPGELLLVPRCRQLLDELQEMFDVILIDTAPLGLVSDALILSQYAGINLFITRQAFTIKEQIRMLEMINRDGKIRNTAILFNGVEAEKKYGYGYGYGYGHGYGSGYYDDDKPEKKGLSKLFKK